MTTARRTTHSGKTGTECTGCGIGYAACTKRILNSESACCTQCYRYDTHDEQDVEARDQQALRVGRSLHAELTPYRVPDIEGADPALALMWQRTGEVVLDLIDERVSAALAEEEEN